MTSVFASNGRKTKTALKEEELAKEQKREQRALRWQSRARFVRRGSKALVFFVVFSLFLWVFR